MSIRSKILMGVLSMMTLWATAASANEAHGRPGWGGSDSAILRSVGLTDSQHTQVRQIRANYGPQFRALWQQLRPLHQQLADNMYSINPTTNAPYTVADLAPLGQQITQLRTQLAQMRLQMELDIRNVLTPDQAVKALQKTQELRQLHSQIHSVLTPQP
jgi:Spy/CpxP family protein refolding chaperone